MAPVDVCEMSGEPLRRVDQVHFGGPDSDEPGDCVRAALASLLGMDPEDVPHFALIELGRASASDDPLRHAWWWALVGWVELLDPPHDIAVVEGDVAEGPEALGGCYLLNGPSPRGPYWHCTVAHSGQVVHDPHPSRDGLADGPRESWVLAMRRQR